jgi:hypothetical protein
MIKDFSYFLLPCLITAIWIIIGLGIILKFEATMSEEQADLVFWGIAIGVFWWPYCVLNALHKFFRGSKPRRVEWNSQDYLTYWFCVVVGQMPVIGLWLIGEVMRGLHF